MFTSCSIPSIVVRQGRIQAFCKGEQCRRGTKYSFSLPQFFFIAAFFFHCLKKEGLSIPLLYTHYKKMDEPSWRYSTRWHFVHTIL